MSGLVVDASVVLAWLYGELEKSRAGEVLDRLKEEGTLVPDLWHLEVRNSLLVAERRGRLSAGDVKERLDALKGLPIRTDEALGLEAAFDLARAYGLTFYDAVYLELAKRENAELATMDAELGRAAASERVRLSVM